MATKFDSILESSIPGFNGLSSSASGLINDLINGNPSTAPARSKAAFFGVNSGMPNSGLSNAFGYDLYKQEGEARKQRGFDDLLKMLTGYSGTVAPTAGQQIEDSQFNANLIQRQKESQDATNLARERIDAAQPRPKKYGFTSSGGYVPGGFKNREWWQ